MGAETSLPAPRSPPPPEPRRKIEPASIAPARRGNSCVNARQRRRDCPDAHTQTAAVCSAACGLKAAVASGGRRCPEAAHRCPAARRQLSLLAKFQRLVVLLPLLLGVLRLQLCQRKSPVIGVRLLLLFAPAAAPHRRRCRQLAAASITAGAVWLRLGPSSEHTQPPCRRGPPAAAAATCNERPTRRRRPSGRGSSNAFGASAGPYLQWSSCSWGRRGLLLLRAEHACRHGGRLHWRRAQPEQSQSRRAERQAGRRAPLEVPGRPLRPSWSRAASALLRLLLPSLPRWLKATRPGSSSASPGWAGDGQQVAQGVPAGQAGDARGLAVSAPSMRAVLRRCWRRQTTRGVVGGCCVEGCC
jgi:hypothetical protein